MVKALQYKTFGKPDVLQLVDLPLVHPKADEVSIKVSHVGLNPMDWAIMGILKWLQILVSNFPKLLPMILLE